MNAPARLERLLVLPRPAARPPAVPPDRTERRRRRYAAGMPDGEERPTEWRDLIRPFVAILWIAFLLRVWQITTNPPEFFEDELSGAVSAWSIVTTGHDVERTVLPFLVTRLELKQPLYFFATVPFQAVLGHNALAARIPAVLFGVVSTALLAGFATRLTGRAVTGFIAAALFAVSPWAIHYARAGWEPAAVLPFTIGGMWLLWVGLRDHRPRLVVGAAVVFAIGAYSYHPALLMHVLLAALIGLISARRLRRPDAVALGIGAGIALVLLIPYALAATDPLFFQRTKAISVFRDGVDASALVTAWQHYWASWSPGFLLGGAAPNPRINPGPAILVATVPFFLAGMDRVIHRRSPEDWLLLGWLVLGPLPTALTSDQTMPSLARSIFALPPLIMITAIGAVWLGEWLTARAPAARRAVIGPAIAVGLSALVVVNTIAWSFDYFGDYPSRSASWWGSGTEAAFTLVKQDVPAGATLCIATNDISGFTYPQQLALYLPNPPFTVLESLGHPECTHTGTYLLTLVSRTLDTPVKEVGQALDYNNQPKFHLLQVVAAGG
jgi:4-amino-4-deoxy-L-arabinose transferase-like glycosyltransferase